MCTLTDCLLLFGAVGQNYMEHFLDTISCLNSLSPVLLNMQEITGLFPLILKAGRALVGELEGVRLELNNSLAQHFLPRHVATDLEIISHCFFPLTLHYK